MEATGTCGFQRSVLGFVISPSGPYTMMTGFFKDHQRIFEGVSGQINGSSTGASMGVHQGILLYTCDFFALLQGLLCGLYPNKASTPRLGFRRVSECYSRTEGLQEVGCSEP